MGTLKLVQLKTGLVVAKKSGIKDIEAGKKAIMNDLVRRWDLDWEYHEKSKS